MVMKGLSTTIVGAFLFYSVRDASAAGPYTFHNVADSTGQFSSFILPWMNNSGTAVFFATFDNGESGIVSGSTSSPPVIVADTTGPYSDLGIDVTMEPAGLPRINDSGTVLFHAFLDAGGSGLFTGPSPATDTVVDTSGPFSGFGGVIPINNNGGFAFFANIDGGGGGIYNGPDPTTDTVIDFSGPFNNFGSPDINDSGTVVVHGFLTSGVDGIYTGPDTVGDVIADTTGPFSSFRNPRINNAGEVLISAGLDGGGEGLFTGPNLVTDTVVDTSGIVESIFGYNINNNGHVAFLATLDSGGSAIFAGLDPLNNEVIAIGDPLFGSTVTGLGLGKLNDLGQQSFRFELSNGITGIAIATPIPEPSSIILCIVAAIVLAIFSYRRRRGALIQYGEC